MEEAGINPIFGDCIVAASCRHYAFCSEDSSNGKNSNSTEVAFPTRDSLRSCD
jgi:hypothetical protein